jgi:DNA polymerase-3 subunit epsilon
VAAGTEREKLDETERSEMTEDRDTELEAMAARLEASGRYRVLRRLPERRSIEPPNGDLTRQALFVDVETTGLNPDDEIIEIAMLRFTYGSDGRIVEIGEAFQRLREPSKPIPPEITALTGISQEMVAGQKIDPVEIAVFIEPAHLIIAHNARFDRPFLERFCGEFRSKPWACSMSQVDWGREGFEGAKLTYLAMQMGYFFDPHRAINDCVAGVELLAHRLPKSGERAMAQLLQRARATTWRVWADGSPFEKKDHLKARGYRWSADSTERPRAWYRDVDEDQLEAELVYLRQEIYRHEIDLPKQRVDARDRFSDRV